MIRKARVADAATVYGIAMQYDLNAEEVQESLSKGFLVSAYSKKEYAGFAEDSNFFYLFEIDAGAIAFLLAFSGHSPHIGPFRETFFEAAGDDFVLIKQVCVDRRYQRGGYGSALYRKVLSDARDRAVAAAIVLQPYNDASVRFHEKLGFRKTIEFTPQDSMRRGLWVKG